MRLKGWHGPMLGVLRDPYGSAGISPAGRPAGRPKSCTGSPRFWKDEADQSLRVAAARGGDGCCGEESGVTTVQNATVTPVALGGTRGGPAVRTLRSDRWWVSPAVTVTLLTAFVAYTT